MTDTELQIAGRKALRQALGPAASARFIALTNRNRFDYTQWRQNQFNDIPPGKFDPPAAQTTRQSPRRELAATV